MTPIVFKSDFLNPPTPLCIDPNGALWRLLKLQQHFDALERMPDAASALISCPVLRDAICSKVPLYSVLLSLGLGVCSPAPFVKLWDERFSEAEDPSGFIGIARDSIYRVNVAISASAPSN